MQLSRYYCFPFQFRVYFAHFAVIYVTFEAYLVKDLNTINNRSYGNNATENVATPAVLQKLLNYEFL